MAARARRVRGRGGRGLPPVQPQPGAARRRLRQGSTLWRFADGLGDVLRRANRGVFMDSVPTVILALRAHELRLAGHAAVADALLAGPLPLAMDDTTRDLARALHDGLALVDADARFRALAALTLRHFDREQAIFSHHLGPPRPGRPGRPARRDRGRGLAGLFTRPPRGVPAPVIAGDRVVTRQFPLPAGFDIRDHDARVRHFGAAFVTSLTRTPAEFHIARALGPAPAPDWSWLDLSW